MTSAAQLFTTAIVWGSAALAPALASIAGLLLARGLVASDYGKVAYFLSCVGVVVLLGSMGLTTQMTTLVAQHRAFSSLDGAVPRVITLAMARLVTIALICTTAIVTGAAGNPVLRAAGLTGGMVLANGFVHGVVRGAGRARLAAGLQVVQAMLYVVLVMAWAGSNPERVYVALAGSYGLALVAALPFCRPLLASCLRVGFRVREPIRSIVSSSSQVYVLSLLLAPFASVAVIILGLEGRYGDAALFSTALTVALAPATALSLVVSIQYYPRACTLGAGGYCGAAWFDSFYRPFASLAVALVAMQIVFPDDAIVALFGYKYLGASESLRSLAAAGAFLTLGQLAVWTLFAYGRVRSALSGTVTQLGVLLAWVVLAVRLSALPLWAIGVGHTVAAGFGLAIYALAIKRLDQRYRLLGYRLVFALLSAMVVEIGLRSLMLAANSSQPLPFLVLVPTTLLALLVSATVLMTALPASSWLPIFAVRRSDEW